MNGSTIDLTSLRARKARLARHIGKAGYEALMALCTIGALGAIGFLLWDFTNLAWLSIGLSLVCYVPAVWYKNELKPLPKRGDALTDTVSGEVLALFRPGTQMTPKSVWLILYPTWQGRFLLNHLWINSDLIEGLLTNREEDMADIWREAARLQAHCGTPSIEAGHIVGALLRSTPMVSEYLVHQNIPPEDTEMAVLWLGRLLDVMHAEKPYFGGIGRDWANGFTPQLNKFGHNISLDIEKSGAHFGWLASSPGVTAITSALSQGATSIALIGESGIGKTSHVHALAQLLLAEKHDRHLEHRQIITLNPSVILSAARHPGDLEQIMLTLLTETVHAGHIILFLDNASLFFTSGNGSFDLTPILLPVLQGRSIQIIMAMSPHEYQQLKARSASFANLLTPVVLQEPPEEHTMRILEDSALNLEHTHKVLVTYEALKEAYRLSGRYNSDTAYPGKAISLLESSLAYAGQHGILLKTSVQQAIEQTQGVKVGTAAPVEADMLLKLEDRIHERMINQKQAVHVVASALRRARAGVTSPNRPIGSFLFLGPTGVGKTELAKAIAAIYFNDESNMIRLDMSEYQQPQDVQRLLSNGTEETSSLIMAVRRQPFSVVLLDEVEKAHPNILNLLLQLLDEGQLTDSDGRKVSFKDCIIIATSNAGAEYIRERIEQQMAAETLQAELTDELIHSGQFRPELLNRFDEIVVFRPLNQDELAQVVRLMMKDINTTLASQHISVELTDAAIHKVVSVGYDARLGARPMRRALQRMVEDSIAGRILRGEAQAGDHIVLDEPDLINTAAG